VRHTSRRTLRPVPAQYRKNYKTTYLTSRDKQLLNGSGVYRNGTAIWDV